MNEATPEPNSKSQNQALIRFRALNFVEDQLRAGRTLAEALRQASLLPWPDEQGDFYKPRTLEEEIRSAARFTNTSEFVPIDKQDTALWSQPMMNDAEEHLRTAASFKRIGRYQLEAAIQSIHAGRAQTGSTDWKQIALLYEGLVRIAPGIGSLVGRAVALARARTPADGFAALEQISADRV